jgi:hypothetical protein
MNGVAEQLEQRAAFAEGSERESLQKLAVSFASSADSRDLSALEGLHAPVAPAAPGAPPPPPFDAVATARSLVDAFTPAAVDGASSDPLDRLNALKSSDLPRFKTVMNGVAEQLEQRAAFAEGSDRESLQNLAVSFASSADSRDLSALEGLRTASNPAAPAAPECATSTLGGWRSMHACASYLRHGPPPASFKAIDDAFSSALALFE